MSLLLFVLYTGCLFGSVSASSKHFSCTKHVQIIYLPTHLLLSHPATLLKAISLSAQHLMESMLFLARVLSLAGGHLLSLVPPFGIPYPLNPSCPQFFH